MPVFGSSLRARLVLVVAIGWVPAVRAVYAPTPDEGIGKTWVVSLHSSVSHDSNIFGAPTGAIESMIYEVVPEIGYTGSLNDQTFAEFNYALTYDHFDNRPGQKNVLSHQLSTRLAHEFNPSTNVDFTDLFQISKNPESLLNGLPVNTDQSFQRNEVDGRFTASLAPKFSTVLKFREIHYAYDNDSLARAIDRDELLYGVESRYDVLPELKAVAEYRHEDIYYHIAGETKNKSTDFAIAGLDYALAKKFSLTGRIGGEWRDIASQGSVDSPYAELSARYDYAKGSYVSGGYVYTFEEASNVAVYNDTHVNRLFVNVQHALSALVFASASVTYEPSVLEGRLGNPNADETTVRSGVALTWVPNAHWSVSASFDHDHVNSQDVSRGQERNRYGVNLGYIF